MDRKTRCWAVVALFLAAGWGAADAAPRYRMSLDVDYAAGTYSGEVAIDYANGADIAQTEVFFRLYGNADALYGAASIVVTSADVGGQSVSPSLYADDTVVFVPLPSPLAPGDATEIVLRFEGSAARLGPTGFATDSEYGLLTRSDSMLTLTAFYPILAPYTSEGWAIDPVAPHGDAAFADAADYDVTLLVPQGVTVIPVPNSVDDAGDGRVRCTFAKTGLRDFPLVLIDGSLTPRSATASGVTIRAWYPLRHEQASLITLDRSVASVDVYSALFGPLPFACVDIVEAPLQRVAGVECSGLFLVAADYAASPRDPFFDIIVSHEMAHQWFYAAVGNDPTEEPWLDESLATFASNVFLSLAVSDDVARAERAQWATAYQQALLSAPDLRVASPLYAFPDSGTYSAFAYSGGAHELDALRQALGDDAFFRGLADYYQGGLGRIAVGSDLERSFRDACGCWPTSPLFDSARTPSL